MLRDFFKASKIWLTRIARILVGAAFSVLIVAVTIQVLGRSGFFDSPVWTEELTRFALLYLTAFGVGLSYLSGDLVNVDIVCGTLPGPVQWALKLVCAIIIVVLCAALIVPAWKFTEIGAFQTSPALGWKMNYIHASVLFLLGTLGVFALIRTGTLLMELAPKTRSEEIQPE